MCGVRGVGYFYFLPRFNTDDLNVISEGEKMVLFTEYLDLFINKTWHGFHHEEKISLLSR
jgi:hypothetical protein